MAKERQLEDIRIDDETRPGPLPLEQFVVDDYLVPPPGESREVGKDPDAALAVALEQCLKEPGTAEQILGVGDSAACPACGATGVCPACGGSGRGLDPAPACHACGGSGTCPDCANGGRKDRPHG